MATLLLKLIFTPLLLGTVSLVARRWGPAIGGVLAALPVVVGSVSFFISVEQGPVFGSRTAAAALVGLGGLGLFSLTYGRTCRRFGWPVCLLIGLGVMSVASIAVIPLRALPGLAAFGLVVATLAIASRLMPAARTAPRSNPPAWDIPARMAIGTALVVGLTTVAGSLGPQLSGLLAAFPMATSVLLVFIHHHEGPERAIGLLRGFLAGLVATSLFLEIVTDGVVPLGIGPAFVLAIAACLAYQAAAIRFLSRRAHSVGEPEPVAEAG